MKTLDLGIKVNKNQVALSRIFLHSLGLYGEVQDLSKQLLTSRTYLLGQQIGLCGWQLPQKFHT
jgi:hypothetical protein